MIISQQRPPIFGYCAPEFEYVRQAFIENMNSREEIGACVSVMREGRIVVNLWGGYKDRDKKHDWEENTLVCIMSATKAIASIAVLSLVDKGLIRLDTPVCEVWPEFAQAGKEEITIQCLLSQLAGLPVADAAPDGSLFEGNAVIKALEIQAPIWPPGTMPCYHSFTHGPLCEEIIRRCTGKDLGSYLRDDLFEPLGLEILLGLKQNEISRCADIIISEGVPTLEQVNQPGTLLNRAWRILPKEINMFESDSFRASGFASGSGHSSARHLAKLYGLLALDIKNDKNTPYLLSKTVLTEAIKEQWDAMEAMTHRHFRYGTGFMLNNRYFTTGPNPRSFGHPGLGGANAFCDPDAGIGFAYLCNRVHPINDTGPCGSALIDATYRSL